MTDSPKGQRGIAICVQCGRKYAAKTLSDGGVQPIGSPSGCKSCGCTEFNPFSLPETDPDSEKGNLHG